MVSPPSNVRRHFLPWTQPLLAQAVTFLTGDWKGGVPLDLSEVLVVVPTRQSGRRLREAIAAHASAQRQAAFPPRVMTPESLIAPGPGPATASRLESQLAWTEIFRDLDLTEFRSVFPLDPPARNFAWAFRLAREFGRLQSNLGEAGLKMADVPAAAGGEFAETERWRQLAVLEGRHAARLAQLGLQDGQAARMARAGAPDLPAGIRRIVLLAAPDPLPLALRALAAHAATHIVDVVVFAAVEESARFDAWGRPVSAAWLERLLDLPDFEERVQLCADPAAQAERMVATATGYGAADGVLAVGVADSEVLPFVEASLRHARRPSFNPEGRPRLGDGLFQLLAALAGLARDDSFAAVELLARCPDFQKWLAAGKVPGFSRAAFLALLDELHAQHLPSDLAAARRYAPEDPGLAAVAELRTTLTTGAFPENAAAALALIFAGRRYDLAQADDARDAEAGEAWTEVMCEVRAAEKKFGPLPTVDGWEIALQLYGESKFTEEKPAGALELQGWLELLWEDAPHLVVGGLNDGSVPDAVVGDPFLPESLRIRLGLKTNAARFARDAYLLHALVACRVAGGRLDLLLGKVSAVGEPLRPSRLLLRCADADLPRRIEFLFREAGATRSTPSWQRAWRLEPPRVVVPARLAVTALRAWLECPFRFYLSQVLRMVPVDPTKSELDALDFGTLCHAALEAMGRETTLRDCTDAAILRDFLLTTLTAETSRRFGTDLTLPLIVQRESARQRLARAAEVQAQSRAEGWLIESVEWKIDLDLNGLRVRGKIDRIDRHERTGAVRVLDYKTSDQPTQPRDAHLRPLRQDETVPEFARWPGAGREQVWRDLQLPLYLRALAADFPGEITCGYFNLPKAATETGLALWDDYDAELAEAAWRCAQGVAAAIRAGDFWPPNERIRPEYDQFAALFHHGAAESVNWREDPR